MGRVILAATCGCVLGAALAVLLAVRWVERAFTGWAPLLERAVAERTGEPAVVRGLQVRMRPVPAVSAHLAAFGGRLQCDGLVELATGRAHLELDGHALPLEAIVRSLAPGRPPVATGAVRSVVGHANGDARADWPETWVAEATAEVADGRWHGTNVVREVVQAIERLPVVGAVIREALPPALIQAAVGDDTPFSTVRATCRSDGPRVECATIALEVPVASFTGTARGVADGAWRVEGRLRLSHEISVALVQRAPMLRGVTDQDQRVSLPLTAAGPLDRLVITPDLRALPVAPSVRDAAERLLERWLGPSRR